MNIFNTLSEIIGAISIAFLSLFSGSQATTTPPVSPQIVTISTTTDTIVQQTVDEATTTTKDDVLKAYELGKAIGKLQAKVEQIEQTNNQINTMQEPVQTQSEPAQSTTTVETGSTQYTQPLSQAYMDIISPIAGKGIGPRRDKVTGENVGYRVSPTYPELEDESNYIELGAIVYGDDGKPVDNATVTITATDSSQNKILNGTGDIATIYVNGEKRQIPVYSFHYEFVKPGQHTITFDSNGMQKTVELTVN